MFQAQNKVTINSTWKVAVNFTIIMMTSVMRRVSQQQTCRTETKTTTYKTEIKTDFFVWDRSCPMTDGLGSHNWHWQLSINLETPKFERQPSKRNVKLEEAVLGKPTNTWPVHRLKNSIRFLITNLQCCQPLAIKSSVTYTGLLKKADLDPAEHRCASGCVVECRICDREVAGSNLGLGYFAPRSTQPCIPTGSVNEYQL